VDVARLLGARRAPAGLQRADLQKRMTEAGTGYSIIFLTGHGDIPMSVRAMKSRAVGFLTKPVREQDLLDAIQQALERDRTARDQRAGIEVLHSGLIRLTPRDREVMGRVIPDCSTNNRGKLGMSETTVKVHRHHVMER